MAFWLIENEEQLEYLTNKSIDDAFVEIIPFHDNIHPSINGVSLVYFHHINDIKGYMLCINHSETFSLDKTLINNLLSKITRIWVRDKKSFLYSFPLNNVFDLSILHPTYIPFTTQAHIHLYSNNPTYPYINKIIPITKHYEKCEHIYEQIKPYINSNLPPYYDFYNNKTIIAYFGIEKNGIKIDKDEFNKHYKQNNEFYSVNGDKIYTHYNLDTTTCRPSNSFNGINFAALNKDNGSRKSFISEHGFIEFDISAYHPHIVSRIIEFDFNGIDIHQSFADLYGTSYKEAKEITFKQLYGGIFKEYEHLEFFQKVKKFIDNNWEEFNNLGQVTVPISGYIFRKDKLYNMNPQKLFNYFLQNIETALNSYILMDIHRLLVGKETKIVLCTYDSFLFQIGENEKDLIEEIAKIFKKYKLTTKTKQGYDYDFK